MIVGDNDGVVVVPSWFAEECVQIVESHEEVELFIKDRIQAENVVPGKYYPPTPESYAAMRAQKGK